MKKLMAMFMIMTLVVSLAACGSKPAADAGTQSGVKEEAQESYMDALPKDATPAQIVIADFKDKALSGEYKDVETLGTAMAEAEYLPFSGAGMPIEEGYLNGFAEEVSGFKAGYMFGPAIGSIPFIGYVFEVEEAKTAEFQEALKAVADLRWNICTEADEMLCDEAAGYVCFVMAPATFEE